MLSLRALNTGRSAFSEYEIAPCNITTHSRPSARYDATETAHAVDACLNTIAETNKILWVVEEIRFQYVGSIICQTIQSVVQKYYAVSNVKFSVALCGPTILPTVCHPYS